MFLQAVECATECGFLTGVELSVISQTCKKVNAGLFLYKKASVVDDMYDALLKRVRFIHPYSEIVASPDSFKSTHKEPNLMRVYFVVSRNTEQRTINVVCHDDKGVSYVTTVRPSVFSDPSVMADNLLAVNRLCYAFVGGANANYRSHVESNERSFLCVFHGDGQPRLDFTVTRNVEHGTVTICSSRPGNPYTTVAYPTLSRALMAAPFTGKLVHTNHRTGNTIESVYSLYRAFYMHGHPRNISNGYTATAVQTA